MTNFQPNGGFKKNALFHLFGIKLQKIKQKAIFYQVEIIENKRI